MKHIMTFKHKFALLLLATLANAAATFAVNKITAEPLKISVGERQTLTLSMENTDEIISMNMQILLPEGMKYVEDSYEANQERLKAKNHSLVCKSVGNLVNVVIDGKTLKPIIGNEGKLFSIDLMAAKLPKGDIRIVDITGAAIGEDNVAAKVKFDDVVVKVLSNAGKVSAQPVELKTDGTPSKMSVEIESQIEARDMQATIILPKGLDIVKDEDGDPVATKGEILAKSHEITIVPTKAKDGYNVIISSSAGDKFKKDEKDVVKGVVFSVDVVADNTFTAETATIRLTKLEISDEDAVGYTLEDAEVAVKNTTKTENEAAYKALSEQAAALQAKLDEAKKTIDETCKDVAANFTEAIAAIQTTIDNIKKDLDAKHKAGELTAESTIDAKSVEDAITKLLADAAAAQEAFVKKAANDAAYKALSEQAAALQTKLDEAKKTIDETCKDVAEDFAPNVAKIQTSIDDIKKDLDAKNAAIELTAESAIDAKSVEDAIAKLLEDAAAAQKKAEEDALKDAINANYAKLTADITALKNKLYDTMDRIENECPDVAADYKGQLERQEKRIDNLQKDLDTKYTTGLLKADDTVDTKSISDAIDKILEEALKAQEATGISAITIGGENVTGVYSLNGQKLAAPVKGQVNIIRTADGKMHKILVK